MRFVLDFRATTGSNRPVTASENALPAGQPAATGTGKTTSKTTAKTTLTKKTAPTGGSVVPPGGVPTVSLTGPPAGEIPIPPGGVPTISLTGPPAGATKAQVTAGPPITIIVPTTFPLPTTGKEAITTTKAKDLACKSMPNDVFTITNFF